MIEVKNASFYYRKDKFLFKNLNLRIKKGRVLAILGPNGVGKTTFLKCLMGFKTLKEGCILVEGKQKSEIGEKKFWKYISYVPQAKNTVFSYTVFEMILMGRAGCVSAFSIPKEEDVKKTKEVLGYMGLEQFAQRTCTTLSTGQLQMVLIARALVKEPKILIMDEPESNLDIKNQIKILEIIEKLKKEKQITTIINTHYPIHAFRISDYVLMLGENINYTFGQASQVITEENMRKYFQVDTKIINVKQGSRNLNGIIPIKIL